MGLRNHTRIFFILLSSSLIIFFGCRHQPTVKTSSSQDPIENAKGQSEAEKPWRTRRGTYREVFRKRSLFGQVIVFDHRGYRCLAFNEPQEMQSCVHLKRKLDFRFEYIEMMFATTLFPRTLKRVLVLGLGGAALPRLISSVYPKAKIHAVEIDPMVVHVAKTLMGYRPSHNTRVHVQDAAAFVKEETKKKSRYDLILVDCYDDKDIPPHLLTKSFITGMRNILKPDGLVAINLAEDAPHYTTTVTRYTDLFSGTWLMDGTRSGNHILVVSQRLPPPSRCRARAKQLDNQHRLPFSLKKTLKSLTGSWPDG